MQYYAQNNEYAQQIIREALDRGKTRQQIEEEEKERENYTAGAAGMYGADRRQDMPYKTINFIFKEFDSVYDLQEYIKNDNHGFDDNHPAVCFGF
jgi:hypothetical protein